VHPCSPLAKLCWFCSLQGLGPVVVVVVVGGWAGERASGSGGRVDARGWDGWDGWGARSKQARHLQPHKARMVVVVVIGACVCVHGHHDEGTRGWLLSAEQGSAAVLCELGDEGLSACSK
jgi:hypothetical protein